MPLRGLRLLWDVIVASATVLALVGIGWLMAVGIDWAITGIGALLGG